jgi:hypothetical protein
MDNGQRPNLVAQMWAGHGSCSFEHTVGERCMGNQIVSGITVSVWFILYHLILTANVLLYQFPLCLCSFKIFENPFCVSIYTTEF